MFQLHARLAADSHPVEDWPLCRVLLMDDRRFPWVILVPRRDRLREIHELRPVDRALLIEEVARASRGLADGFGADKINVAALGNQVPQLHVHIVARFARDAAQPGLVWGAGRATPYGADERAAMIARLRAAFAAEGAAPGGPDAGPRP